MIRDNQEKGSEGGDYSEAYRNGSTILDTQTGVGIFYQTRPYRTLTV